MHIVINMDYGKKKLNKKGVRMMQTTKEAVIVVAVHTHTHTHTDSLKNNKNNNYKGNIMLPCGFIDTG